MSPLMISSSSTVTLASPVLGLARPSGRVGDGVPVVIVSADFPVGMIHVRVVAAVVGS
jgi:hypothetical protein